MLAGQAKVDSKRLAAAEKALEKMVASAAKAAPKDTAAEPTDAKQKMLEAAVDGKLDMRSALGQQFARSKTGGKSDSYREAKTYAAKKTFQKEWCELELQNHMAAKTTTQTFRMVDKSKGKYKSLQELAQREGIEKATHYAQKCIELGETWVEWDAMWDHWTYFEFERTWAQEFSKAWGLHTSMTSTSTSGEPEHELFKRAHDDGAESTTPPKKAARTAILDTPESKGRSTDGDKNYKNVGDKKDKKDKKLVPKQVTPDQKLSLIHI